MTWIAATFWLLLITSLAGATALDGPNDQPTSTRIVVPALAFNIGEERPEIVYRSGLVSEEIPADLPRIGTVTAQAESSGNLGALVASEGVERWRPLVVAIFGEAPTGAVLTIMGCESGGNPDAVSPTNDHGLMQINGVNHHRFRDTFGEAANPYDPAQNLEVARQMSSNGTDWWAWSCKSRLQ